METHAKTESPVRDEHSSNGVPEKGVSYQEETFHEAAERGHVATDKYNIPQYFIDAHSSNRTIDMVTLSFSLTRRLSVDCAGRLIFTCFRP
jgi:hypothetical protein